MMLTTTALSTTTGAAEDRVDEDGDVQTPDAIDEAFMAWYDLRAVVGDEIGGRTPPPVYADTGRDDAMHETTRQDAARYDTLRRVQDFEEQGPKSANTY